MISKGSNLLELEVEKLRNRQALEMQLCFKVKKAVYQ